MAAIVVSQMVEMPENGWVIYVFAGVFALLGLALLSQLFLPPKEFKAELKIKTEQDFKGNIITYMVFEPILPNNSARMKKSCSCYTQTSNNLVVGKTYRILVKNYNYMIRVLNPNIHAGAENNQNSFSGAAQGSNNVSEKLLREKERLLDLGVLSKYDFKPDTLKLDTFYLKHAKVKLPGSGEEAAQGAVVDISGKKLFYIKETGIEKMGEDVFYLTDEEDQVIYQFARRLPNAETWIVSDAAEKPVAQIEVNVFWDVRRTTVRMVNGTNFSVKPPLYVGDEFEIVGINYTARKTNQVGTRHITYFTREGKLAGELNPEDVLPAGRSLINTRIIKLNFNQTATPELLLLICCGRGMRQEGKL